MSCKTAHSALQNGPNRSAKWAVLQITVYQYCMQGGLSLPPYVGVQIGGMAYGLMLTSCL